MAGSRFAVTFMALATLLGLSAASVLESGSGTRSLKAKGSGINFSAYPGFPWCSCGVRDIKAAPWRLTFSGYETFGENTKQKFACFKLLVLEEHDCAPSKARCSNMDISKIEFDTVSERFTPDARINGKPKAATWGPAPEGHNVLKITELDITREDVEAAGGSYAICISLGPKAKNLGELSGLKGKKDDISYSVFSDKHDQCCPTSTMFKPTPPAPPPRRPSRPANPPPEVPCHPAPSPPATPPVDPAFPYCRCDKKATGFTWALSKVNHTIDDDTLVEHVTFAMDSNKSRFDAFKLELKTTVKCRNVIRNAKINNKVHLSASWENKRPVAKFSGINLRRGRSYTLEFDLVGCTLNELCGYDGKCQYAFFDSAVQGGKCPVQLCDV